MPVAAALARLAGSEGADRKRGRGLEDPARGSVPSVLLPGARRPADVGASAKPVQVLRPGSREGRITARRRI